MTTPTRTHADGPDERSIGLDAGTGGSPGGTGRLMPDATLPMAGGGALSLDRYRPRWNLVLVMLGAPAVSPSAARLLTALAAARADVEAEDGQVLAIGAGAPPALPNDWAWPFPLAFDVDGSLHRHVGSIDDAGAPAMALYITDPYREIFAVLRPFEPGWPENAGDVLQWLRFVNIQCPECAVPDR